MRFPARQPAVVPPACRPFVRRLEQGEPAALRRRRRDVSREWNGDRLFLRHDWSEGDGPGADDEDDFVATLRLQVFPAHRVIWIGSVEVDPGRRRRGLGRDLIRSLEAAAVATGYRSIRLFSRGTAAGFWRRLGYRPEADRRYFRKTLARPGGADDPADSLRPPVASSRSA